MTVTRADLEQLIHDAVGYDNYRTRETEALVSAIDALLADLEPVEKKTYCPRCHEAMYP